MVFLYQYHHSKEYASTNSYCIHISRLLQRTYDNRCYISTLLNHTALTKCKYVCSVLIAFQIVNTTDTNVLSYIIFGNHTIVHTFTSHACVTSSNRQYMMF